jgi:hypothetical protein
MAQNVTKAQAMDVNESVFYLSPSGGMIIVILIILVYTLARFCLCSLEEDEDQVEDEGLAPYWQAYRDEDRPTVIGLEMHNIEKGYKTYTDEQFSNLQASSQVKDNNYVMQDVPSYRILENINYLQDFQFEPKRYENGKLTCKHIYVGHCEHSDVSIGNSIVSLTMNFGYV